ncbi:MAG: SCF ubiquitin ligase complex subunit [Sclerophora amabilis]|nr:MAG: SCF ubiquitin ligase complex subunit [Sclerophora amabilis]
MSRSRRAQRVSTDPTSESSSSSSPERAGYDDTDFFTAQANDSQSSIGASTFREMTVSPATERERQVSPVSRLPAELLISVFAKLSSPTDMRNCMLVCKIWARNSVDILWHRPLCNSWKNLLNVVTSVRKQDSYFAYYDLVKRLNFSSLSDQVSDGSIVPLAGCKRVERLTLTNCTKLSDSGVMALINGNRSLLALDISGLELISDHTLMTVAENCSRLQGLNITGCKQVTDKSLIAVSENCPSIKRLKLNECSQLTNDSIVAFANNCRQMLEIDLHSCSMITDISVTSLLNRGSSLRELRLASCSMIKDEAFMSLPADKVFENLRILDLTACESLTDAAVAKIIYSAPRLRNLVLAKCRKISDDAVLAITKLGKNLHYVHLGHCASITDRAVIELIKSCNRIRYIDLACCHRLTDASIQQLAALPKLRRIGLVKCQEITDRSIMALARPRVGSGGVQPGTSSLERGIHALLINCPRLTHLSLTGVQAFLRDGLTAYCRAAPDEFTDHQREVFCVFSGAGVTNLREHLNQEALAHDADGFMYEDGDDTGVDEQQVVGMIGATALDGGDDLDELFGDESELGDQG